MIYNNFVGKATIGAADDDDGDGPVSRIVVLGTKVVGTTTPVGEDSVTVRRVVAEFETDGTTRTLALTVILEMELAIVLVLVAGFAPPTHNRPTQGRETGTLTGRVTVGNTLAVGRGTLTGKDDVITGGNTVVTPAGKETLAGRDKALGKVTLIGTDGTTVVTPAGRDTSVGTDNAVGSVTLTGTDGPRVVTPAGKDTSEGKDNAVGNVTLIGTEGS